MTTTIVFDPEMSLPRKQNADDNTTTSSEQTFLRKKIKKVNRLLKDLKKDLDSDNSGRKYYNYLLQKRAEYTSLLVDESSSTKADDATESTASTSSSWSSCADEMSLPSFFEEEDSNVLDNERTRVCEKEVSYDDLRRKLNKVSRQLNESDRSDSRYQRLLEKRAKYTEALVEMLEWQE